MPLDFSPREDEHCIEGLYCDQAAESLISGMVLYSQLASIYVARGWLGKALGGQPSIINAWMAGMNAVRMTHNQSEARHVALVAKLFSLAVVMASQASPGDFILSIERLKDA